jgi:hypothetical protein
MEAANPFRDRLPHNVDRNGSGPEARFSAVIAMNDDDLGLGLNVRRDCSDLAVARRDALGSRSDVGTRERRRGRRGRCENRRRSRRHEQRGQVGGCEVHGNPLTSEALATCHGHLRVNDRHGHGHSVARRSHSRLTGSGASAGRRFSSVVMASRRHGNAFNDARVTRR